MRKIILTATLSLALLFMAAASLHAASGTYIDCIHGCPKLIACTNCCNETFSGIMATCTANRDQCEALCPPGNMDCLDGCMMARNNCLRQDIREFDCPHWGGNVRNLGVGSGTGISVFGNVTPSANSRSECKECHEDNR